jgi:hypothetical protein
MPVAEIRAQASSDVVVREFYRAIEQRDLARLVPVLEADVTWSNAVGGTGGSDDGALTGCTAILERLAGLVDSSGGTFDLRVQSMFAGPADVVVAFQEVSLPGGGFQTGCVLFELRQGRIRALSTLVAVPNS